MQDILVDHGDYDENDDGSGVCLDKRKHSCERGTFQRGLCPGGNHIQCCSAVESDGDNNRRRRFLGKTGEEYDYSALWADFVEYVEVDDQQADVCSSGQDMLSQVDVDSNGAFEFRCGRSPRLCECISAISVSCR